eukprot:1508219-Rhodomonas_salina.1
MGSGASSADLTQQDVDFDQDDPPYAEEERRQVEQDMRNGVVLKFTGEVGEMRVPAAGRGACGADTRGMWNLAMTAREETDEGWDKHRGGAAAQVEAHFRLTRKHIIRVLVGGVGKKAYCGGGASYIGTRIAEEVGWEMDAPRPKVFWVPVPGENVRPHGKPFITWAESFWGSRVARMPVSIPKYILPKSMYRVKIPGNVRFLRNWETLLIAGGGGGAGQNSNGHDAVLEGEGTKGSGSTAGSGGKDGGAGESRLEGNYPTHGGSGLKGSGKSHQKHFGAQSLVLGGKGSSGCDNSQVILRQLASYAEFFT